MEAIKRDLKNCQTTDFLIAFRNKPELREEEIAQDLHEGILDSSKREDLIIYTYEQFLGLSEHSILPKGYLINLEEISC